MASIAGRGLQQPVCSSGHPTIRQQSASLAGASVLPTPSIHSRVARQGTGVAVRAELKTTQQKQENNSPFQWFKRAGQVLKDSVVPQVFDPEKEEFEVEKVLGVRVMIEEEEGSRPFVQYLVKWKDGSPCTWELGSSISEDVLRDYEQGWWNCAREGDVATMKEMLMGGKKMLANTIDENGRCALHFTAAIGNADCTQLLIDFGADVNAADKDGYTPLHMAAGYLHTSTVISLLNAGADSEQQDNQGRDPMELINSLKRNLPPNVPELLPRRAGLEAVSRVMVDSLFEVNGAADSCQTRMHGSPVCQGSLLMCGLGCWCMVPGCGARGNPGGAPC